LPSNGILPGAKLTLSLSVAFSYIGRVTALHWSSGRQPNCGVEQRAPPIFDRAAITLSFGPHSSFSKLLVVWKISTVEVGMSALLDCSSFFDSFLAICSCVFLGLLSLGQIKPDTAEAILVNACLCSLLTDDDAILYLL